METTVNGLTVIADSTLDRLSKRKVLRSSAIALSTIQEIPFDGLPDVTVKLWAEGEPNYPRPARWSGRNGNYIVDLTRYADIEEWRAKYGWAALRHEFFHHFLQAGGITYEQMCELFTLAHQVEPNGSMPGYWTPTELPRYWPNDDKTDPGCKWWLEGGDYGKRAGENYAYLLQEMYDGEDDGIANVFSFPGRKKLVVAETRRMLEAK